MPWYYDTQMSKLIKLLTRGKLMLQKKHKSAKRRSWLRYAALSLGLVAVVKLSTISAKAIEAGWYDIQKSNISIDENGVHRFEDGSLVQDAFLFDGVYTYFIQKNGKYFFWIKIKSWLLDKSILFSLVAFIMIFITKYAY